MIMPLPNETVFSTGGQIDAITGALIDAAYDKNENVRSVMCNSLHEVGKKQPLMVLSACHSYLHRHAKLPQGHRTVILSVMKSVCKDSLDTVKRPLAVDLIQLASAEMTHSKDVIPEWQTVASGVLVALGCKFCNEVMEELLTKFQPGVLPHFFTVQTLANLATANVYGVVPFLTAILGTMLPMMGMVKQDNMRWVFTSALAKFSESILDYIANIDKAPDQSVKASIFAHEIDSAYDVLFNVWLQSKEVKVRVAVIEALGYMAHLMDRNKLEEQLAKLVPGIVRLYSRHQENPFPITQAVAMILDAAANNDLMLPENQFDSLLNILYAQACQVLDYTNAVMLKNQNEVLRCFNGLARASCDKVLAYLVQKLEVNNEKARIGALRVFRHLINTADSKIGQRKSVVLSGLKIAMTESNNKVKKMFVQVIVALAHHDYLREQGGDQMVEFMIRQCAQPSQAAEKQKKNADPEFVSSDSLRSVCSNILQSLATTVDNMESVLWPLLLEYVVADEYTPALPIVSKCLDHLVNKKRVENAEDFEIDFDKSVNIPKPHALISRLLVTSSNPWLTKDHGVHVLRLMKGLSPNLNKNLVALWDTVIPKLIQYLEEAAEKDEDAWCQKSWEELTLKFLCKTLEDVDSENWTIELGNTMSSHLALYSDLPNEKKFLCKAIGIILRRTSQKSFITNMLDTLFVNTKHLSIVEREGCAIAFGYGGSTHLDTVLSRLYCLSQGDSAQKRSGGLLGFIKDKIDTSDIPDSDRNKATVILCYGYIAYYAQPDQLTSYLDTHILRGIVPHFQHAKEHAKISLMQSVELLGRALHPDHLKFSYEMPQQWNLISSIMAFVKNESTKHLTTDTRELAMKACTSMIKLDPKLDDDATSLIIETFAAAVYPLPVDIQVEDPEGADLLQRTLSNLNELFKELLLKDVSSCNLNHIVTHLEQWLCSNEYYERDRAAKSVLLLLSTFHEKLEFGVGKSTIFDEYGKLLGLFVPRVSDPTISVRQSAIDCIQYLLQIDSLYQGNTRETNDPLISALSELKSRCVQDDANVLFSTVNDLAKVLAKKVQVGQLPSFLQSVLNGLLDTQEKSSSGACVVLNTVLKSRGSELHTQVETFLGDLKLKLSEISFPQTRIGTLRCVRSLAYHHLLEVVNCLLKYPIPFDTSIRDCWQVMASDSSSTAQDMIDKLLDFLEHAVPYSEKPLSVEKREKDKVKPIRVAQLQPLTVLCALTEIFNTEGVYEMVTRRYARIFAALLLSVGAMAETKPPHSEDQDDDTARKKANKSHTKSKHLSSLFGTPTTTIQPNKIAAESLQSFLRCTKGEAILADIACKDWEMFSKISELPSSVCGLARSLAEHNPEVVTSVITTMNQSLGSVYETQRIVAIAFLGELLAHCEKVDQTLIEVLMNSLMSRLVDPSQVVRMYCIRGLGNIAAAGSGQTDKYSTTILSAMMAGMDDREDTEDDITLAAMSGLSKVLSGIDECNVRSILINIALRIRPCFEKERPEVRVEAFRLFGNLSRFADGPSREPFLEQIHANIVSLLLHLNDKEDDVVKACKYALKLLGPLICSDQLNEMFQKHLLDDANLHYGEFMNDLSKVLICDFPEKLNFYVIGNLAFFKSSWPEIRANAAMFTGFLLGNLPQEQQQSISKEHVCGALILMLKDPEADVKIKAAEAMSLLYRY